MPQFTHVYERAHEHVCVRARARSCMPVYLWLVLYVSMGLGVCLHASSRTFMRAGRNGDSLNPTASAWCVCVCVCLSVCVRVCVCVSWA